MCKRGLVTAGLCCCVSVLARAQVTEPAPDRAGVGTSRSVTRSTKQTAATADKVTICHKSGPVKYDQITVAPRALPAHLAHGDCEVDDGVSCTVDRCDTILGCVHAPDNGACDDGDACTSDSCDPATGCVYTPISCDDGDACTTDSCDPVTGCRNTDIPTCGACCLPDDSCLDLSADECTAQGGEPQGAGTDCATTQCCIPPFGTGCTTFADCCNLVDCNGGTCCNALGFECGTVDNHGPCCDPNAICGDAQGQGCCLPPFSTGCTTFADCCNFVDCNEGICCNALGRECGGIDNDGPCCDPNAICSVEQGCCLPPFSTGCSTFADCCNSVDCNGGICCNALGFECGGVDNDGPCCDPNAICSGNTCCIPQLRSCAEDSECCSGLCTSGTCEGVSKP